MSDDGYPEEYSYPLLLGVDWAMPWVWYTESEETA